jgi:hypothetical protein
MESKNSFKKSLNSNTAALRQKICISLKIAQ